jgi:hypothetical protein
MRVVHQPSVGHRLDHRTQRLAITRDPPQRAQLVDIGRRGEPLDQLRVVGENPNVQPPAAAEMKPKHAAIRNLPPARAQPTDRVT